MLDDLNVARNQARFQVSHEPHLTTLPFLLLPRPVEITHTRIESSSIWASDFRARLTSFVKKTKLTAINREKEKEEEKRFNFIGRLLSESVI